MGIGFWWRVTEFGAPGEVSICVLKNRTLEAQYPKLRTMVRQEERRLVVEVSNVGAQVIGAELHLYHALAPMPSSRWERGLASAIYCVGIGIVPF